MYVSNPKVQGMFAYSRENNVEEISDFINKQEKFLKKYEKTTTFPSLFLEINWETEKY